MLVGTDRVEALCEDTSAVATRCPGGRASSNPSAPRSAVSQRSSCVTTAGLDPDPASGLEPCHMTINSTYPARPAPPVGGFQEVDGRRVFLHRSGSGGPAVVFLPGAGAVGLDYFGVRQQVSRLRTAVVYDRGGTGYSDPAPLPRTATAVFALPAPVGDTAGPGVVDAGRTSERRARAAGTTISRPAPDTTHGHHGAVLRAQLECSVQFAKAPCKATRARPHLRCPERNRRHRARYERPPLRARHGRVCVTRRRPGS